MARDQDAITEARFAITRDGVQIGKFETLLAAVVPGAPPRALQVHELPLLLQQAKNAQSDRVTVWEHNFEMRPGKHAGPHAHKITDITLKRGVCSRASIERWAARGGSKVSLMGLGPAGQPIARYELTMAWPRKFSSAVDVPAAMPSKIAGPALHGKGGGEVAIETLEIAHQGLRRD